MYSVAANNADLKGRNIGTPIGMTPTIGLPPPDQLGGYVHVAFPSQPLPWHHAAATPMVMCEVPPDPSSPLVSRQSSPSQSGSPSRAGSPAAQPRPPVSNERGSQQNFKVPPQRRLRQNCVDGSIPHGQRSVSRKGSAEPLDGLRETLGKEMPTFVSNLQNYSIDEVKVINFKTNLHYFIIVFLNKIRKIVMFVEQKISFPIVMLIYFI